MFINNIAALTELCNSRRHTNTREPSQEMNCCPISIQTNCVNTPKLYTCRWKRNRHASRLSAWDLCEIVGAQRTGVRSGRERDTDWGPAEPSQANDSHTVGPKEKYNREAQHVGRQCTRCCVTLTHEAHKWLTRRRPLWVVFHVYISCCCCALAQWTRRKRCHLLSTRQTINESFEI